MTSIADFAFAYSSETRQIVFPDNIDIGNSAFIGANYNDESLTLIFGGDDITVVDNDGVITSFDGMSKAPLFIYRDGEAIEGKLPDSVILNNMESANVGKESYAFDNGCLYYTDEGGNAHIKYYVGRDTEWNVPQTLGGSAVYCIDNDAALGRDFITRVEFPEGMKQIYYHAFFACDNLREVVFSTTLDYINEQAFDESPVSSMYFRENRNDNGYFTNDDVLYRDVNDNQYALCYIPEGWGANRHNENENEWEKHEHYLELLFENKRELVIFSGAYSGSLYITNINIPDNTVRIDDNAFGDCHYYGDGSENSFISLEFCGARPELINTPFGCGTDDIGIWLKNPDGWNFDNDDYIHASDDEFPKYKVCHFPWKAELNEEGQFNVLRYYGIGDENNHVEVPETFADNGEDKATVGICGEAFVRNTMIRSIAIPASVSFIDENAFYGCTSLESISVEGSEYFIADANGLYHKLENGEKGDVIWQPFALDEETEFLYRVDSEEVDGVTVETITITGYVGESENIVIPEAIDGKNVTKIVNGQYGQFKTIFIPRYVEVIEHHFYPDCFNRFTVDENNGNFTDIDGVLFTKDKSTLYLFPIGRGNDYTYVVPEGTTRIGAFAFHDNNELETLILPASLTEIAANAFDNAARWVDEDSDEMLALSLVCGGAPFAITGDETPFNACGPVEVIYRSDMSESWEEAAYSYPNGDAIQLTAYACENNFLYFTEESDGVEYAVIFRYIGCEEAAVEIPETLGGLTVKVIGFKSLEGSVITSLTIGKDVSEIRDLALRSMKRITSFTVDADNSVYSSSEGVLYRDISGKYGDSARELVTYPAAKSGTTFDIDANVREIGMLAFAGSDLYELHFHSDRPSFGYRAFEVKNPDDLIFYYDNNGCNGWSTPYVYDGDNKFKTQPVSVGVRYDDYTYYVDDRGTEDTTDDCAVISFYYGEAKDTDANGTSIEGLVRIPETIAGYKVGGIGQRIMNENNFVKRVEIPSTVEWIDNTSFDGANNIHEYGVYVPNENGYTIENGEPVFVYDRNGESRYYTADGVLYEKNYDEHLDEEYITLKRFPADSGKGYFNENENVREVVNSAFCNVRGLDGVSFGDKLTQIYSYAFNTSEPINEVSFDNAPPSIDIDAFTNITDEFRFYYKVGCGGWTTPYYYDQNGVRYRTFAREWRDGYEFYVENGEAHLKGYDRDRTNTNVIIPETIYGYPVVALDNTFRDNDRVENVTIPASVGYINEWAFFNATSLKNIYVNENNPFYDDIDGVLYTEGFDSLIAYPCGRDYPSFTVAQECSSIAENAFGCAKLEEIVLKARITEIRWRAFSDMENLNSIRFYYGYPVVGDGIFDGTNAGNVTFYYINGESRWNELCPYRHEAFTGEDFTPDSPFTVDSMSADDKALDIYMGGNNPDINGFIDESEYSFYLFSDEKYRVNSTRQERADDTNRIFIDPVGITFNEEKLNISLRIFDPFREYSDIILMLADANGENAKTLDVRYEYLTNRINTYGMDCDFAYQREDSESGAYLNIEIAVKWGDFGGYPGENDSFKLGIAFNEAMDVDGICRQLGGAFGGLNNIDFANALDVTLKANIEAFAGDSIIAPAFTIANTKNDTPEIDGAIDELYGDAIETSVENFSKDAYYKNLLSEITDINPEIYVAYDDQNIYIATRTNAGSYAQTNDDNTNMMWKQSCMQIGLSAAGSSDNAMLELGIARSTIGENAKLLAVWNDYLGRCNSEATMGDFEVAYDSQTNTLTYEIRVPWSVFLENGYAQAVEEGFGMCLVWGFNSANNNYTHIQFADGVTMNGKRAQNFAKLTLEDAAAPVTVSGISVAVQPTKKNYNVGETFNPSGMVVMLNYSDGTSAETSDYTFAPSEALTEANKVITITYNGNSELKAYVFGINVVDDTVTPNFKVEASGGGEAMIGSKYQLTLTFSEIDEVGLISSELLVSYDKNIFAFDNGSAQLTTSPSADWEISAAPNAAGNCVKVLLYDSKQTTPANTDGSIVIKLTFTVLANQTSLSYEENSALSFNVSGILGANNENNDEMNAVNTTLDLILKKGITVPDGAGLEMGSLKDGTKYITGIHEEQTVSEVIATLGEALTIYDLEGNEVDTSDTETFIGTGFTVKLIIDGEVIDSAKLVIYGDLDGNGKILTNDFIRIKYHILNNYNNVIISPDTDEIEYLAANVVKANDAVNINDFTAVLGQSLGRNSIYK